MIQHGKTFQILQEHAPSPILVLMWVTIICRNVVQIYNGDPNTVLVLYSNGQNKSSCRIKCPNSKVVNMCTFFTACSTILLYLDDVMHAFKN